MMIWAALAAFATACFLSALAVPMTRRLAVKFNMLDVPGRHKAHARPVPLLGGCAIFAAVALPLLLGLGLVRIWASTEAGPPHWLRPVVAIHVPGAAAMAPGALIILAGAGLLHVLGLLDDRMNLSPWIKLLAEIALGTGLVLLVPRVRAMTALGEPWSSMLTVLWLTAIANAFNFLDNMDGLSAGVGAICAAALLGVSAHMGQVFVSAWLVLLLGALLGFLPYNFAPARSFMGDAGSLVIGYFLGVLSCLVTYVAPGERFYLYGVFIPLVVMALPIYDMVSVITLRLRERRNPMVGDRRHFSHRLVRRGMNVRTAVVTIYLCTGGTSIAATLLLKVDNFGAILIFAQTVIILLIVAMLEMGDTRP
jgi:UDP-GlcNAc:undecaprenyl-phosphate/decaprenyl-phosphate GlcNAc-1-phosphate transferase